MNAELIELGITKRLVMIVAVVLHGDLFQASTDLHACPFQRRCRLRQRTRQIRTVEMEKAGLVLTP